MMNELLRTCVCEGVFAVDSDTTVFAGHNIGATARCKWRTVHEQGDGDGLEVAPRPPPSVSKKRTGTC